MSTEKKKISKRVVGTIIGVAVALVALVVLVFISLNKDFDAQTYVNVILDYTYKGKTEIEEEKLYGMFDEESLMHLENQYETQMVAFVENSVTGGVELEKEMEEKYLGLCKDILKSMKYEVKTSKKINADKYQVTVEYQVADVFAKYMELAATQQQRIMDKVEKGEYQGTEAEVNAQLQTEAIESNYELLKTSFDEMGFAEKEKVVFTVKRGNNELFAMDNAELSDFIVKIVGLDEKQD